MTSNLEVLSGGATGGEDDYHATLGKLKLRHGQFPYLYNSTMLKGRYLYVSSIDGDFDGSH